MYVFGPSVRGDNPRALASGLFPVQADEPWYTHTKEIILDL